MVGFENPKRNIGTCLTKHLGCLLGQELKTFATQLVFNYVMFYIAQTCDGFITEMLLLSSKFSAARAECSYLILGLCPIIHHSSLTCVDYD